MRQMLLFSAVLIGVGDIALFGGEHLWQIGRGAIAQLDWLRHQAEYYTRLPA